jgi:hypothetical protein
MATRRNVYFGRPSSPAPEKLRTKALPEHLEEKREVVETTLAILDGVACFHGPLIVRIVYHLAKELDGDKDLAKELVAQHVGYATWDKFKKSGGNGEFHKERAKHPGIVAQVRGDMRSKSKVAKETAAAEMAIMDGVPGFANGLPVNAYFFFKEPMYLVAIEDLMVEYNDCYLQTAVESYPDRMQFGEYNRSFGIFWKEVTRLHSSGKIDFSVPGLLAIKKLCHQLFSWNFRRYLAGDIIRRYAPSLPREYRAFHVAAKRDNDIQEVVDIDYSDYPVIDYDEEPDDNIGNC